MFKWYWNIARMRDGALKVWQASYGAPTEREAYNDCQEYYNYLYDEGEICDMDIVEIQLELGRDKDQE